MFDGHDDHDSLLLLLSEKTFNCWARLLWKMVIRIIEYVYICRWAENSSKWYFLKLTGSESFFFVHHEWHSVEVFYFFSQSKAIVDSSYLRVLDIFVVERDVFLNSCIWKDEFLWHVCYFSTQKHTSFYLLHWTNQHVNETCYSLTLLAYY